MNNRIVLAGGSGFLGAILSRWFMAAGNEVIILTRSPRERTDGVKEVGWNGESIGEWATVLEGARAVINLAGRSVNCRYHARNRRAILESRLFPTRTLGEAIARCAEPPAVWLNSSTATIYKHSFDRAMDESGEIGGTPAAKDLFSVEVGRAWEQVFAEANTPRTRKVVLRTAMVFGAGAGGVFRVLRRLARWGLGGAMGGGSQFVSWIHEEDFCRAITWLIERDDLCGPVNLAAPHPVSNREMMRLLREVRRAPFGLPATRWMLEIGAFFLRTETELIIKSRRVVPSVLPASGFRFNFPTMEAAAREIERRIAQGA